jgi:hypothetical protein
LSPDSFLVHRDDGGLLGRRARVPFLLQRIFAVCRLFFRGSAERLVEYARQGVDCSSVAACRVFRELLDDRVQLSLIQLGYGDS